MTDIVANSLANTLTVPTGLLRARAPQPYILQRLQSSLPAHLVKTLRAEFSLAHFHIRRLLGRPAASWPRLAPEARPSEHASALRRSWRVGAGPIEDMVGLLESHGVVVLMRDLSGLRTPAVGSWSQDEHPVVFLDPGTSPREARAALAREIGHAVMHKRPAHQSTREAIEFATELLLPSQEVIWNWVAQMDRTRLRDLEETWGVPASVILDAARRAGAITSTQQRKLKSIVSGIGTEARPHPRERPRALLAAVQRQVAAGATLDHVAASMLLDRASLQTKFLAGAG